MKKIFILSLSLIAIMISLQILNNYFNPNVEGSIRDTYKNWENVQVLQTDWYGSEGLTFFVKERLNDNEKYFCKGYVSKNLFQTKTKSGGCVPLSNNIVNEGVVGTSTLNGKPIIYGFTGADTIVSLKGEEVISITYKNIQAWYAFYDKTASLEEPIFQF